MTGWRAVLSQAQPYDRSTRLHVYRHHADGRVDVLMPDGVIQRLEEGTVPPDNAGLIIPEDALEAIAEAFHPHATGQARLEGEVRVMREIIRAEAARVDKIIDRALEH